MPRLTPKSLMFFVIPSPALPGADPISIKKNPTGEVQEHPESQIILDDMYARGSGMPQDSPEVLKWHFLAAVQGIARAQCNLGKTYTRGKGGHKDESEGLAWSNIAAASGNERIIQNRDLTERRMEIHLLLAARKRSQEILQEIKAANPAPISP